MSGDLLDKFHTCHTFKNNLGMKHTFSNQLEESTRISFDERLPFRYFLIIALVREIDSDITKKSQAVLAATGINVLRL